MNYYIKGFNGLRAISISFVLLEHLGVYDLWSPFFREKVWPFVCGTSGVNIFFAISGYLITTILLREKEKNGNISIKNFFARRFLRLMPPLILFVITVGLIMFWGPDGIKVSKLGLIFASFYCLNFAPRILWTHEITHTWSLAIEEQFYLIWPWVIKYGNVAKRIIGFCIAMVFLSLAFIAYKGQIADIFVGFRIMKWFIPASAPIFLGALAGFLNFRHELLFSKYFSKNWMLVIGIVLSISSLILPSQLLDYFMIVHALGTTIVLLYVVHRQQSVLTNTLEFTPINYIGKISYGIYIWQGIFLTTGPGGKLWVQQFPHNVIITLGVAIISFHTLEKYALSYKKYFSYNLKQ